MKNNKKAKIVFNFVVLLFMLCVTMWGATAAISTPYIKNNLIVFDNLSDSYDYEITFQNPTNLSMEVSVEFTEGSAWVSDNEFNLDILPNTFDLSKTIIIEAPKDTILEFNKLYNISYTVTDILSSNGDMVPITSEIQKNHQIIIKHDRVPSISGIQTNPQIIINPELVDESVSKDSFPWLINILVITTITSVSGLYLGIKFIMKDKDE